MNKSLVTAIRSGDVEAVKAQFRRPGTDANGPIQGGRSAIHIAVDAGKIEIAKFLVSKGADVNLQDEDDCTPLLYALMKDNKPMTAYLLEMGADKNMSDPDGRPVYESAKSEDIKQLLSEH